MEVTPALVDVFAATALDLCQSLPSRERYQRLVSSVRRILPGDAVALLRSEGEYLIPVAVEGLKPELVGQRLALAAHPRLAAICNSQTWVKFPADDPRPDPYDGLIAAQPAPQHIHSCVGAPLWVEGQLVGCLTVDALEPGRFDQVDDRWVLSFAALAAATMRTALLIDQLEQTLARREQVAQVLVSEALARHGSGLVGTSEVMRRLHVEIDLAARSGLPVLISGETGVGKELVARTVHARSPRARRPLVAVNCAALPESLAESELFGHVRGAFTGASGDRAGRFEVAHEGTLFLDEIGELPLALQPLLLRAIQFGEIQRIGAAQVQSVDVRLISATNRPLAREIGEGRFRQDLFHRIGAFPLQVPPLRARVEDIPNLVQHFIDESKLRLGLNVVRVEKEAMAALQSYSWPGNVRELQNLVSRAVVRASDAGRLADVYLTREHLAVSISSDPWIPTPTRGTFSEQKDTFERAVILKAVADAGGRWAQAARSLGLDKSNLHRMAQRLGLKSHD